MRMKKIMVEKIERKYLEKKNTKTKKNLFPHSIFSTYVGPTVFNSSNTCTHRKTSLGGIFTAIAVLPVSLAFLPTERSCCQLMGTFADLFGAGTNSLEAFLCTISEKSA